MLNHHLLPPLGLALAAGTLFPTLLVRASWPHRAPRLALTIWVLLGAMFTLATALLPVQMLLPQERSHALTHWVEACLSGDGGACGTVAELSLSGLYVTDWVAAGAFLAVLTVPLVTFVRVLKSTQELRAQHAEILRLVGHRDTELHVTVLQHSTPAVYCLPGRNSQLVVSSGALSVLSERQLNSALAHERAHIRGRHHVPAAAAAAFRTVFRRLPLARLAGEQVPLLLEMAADDQALRQCSRQELATTLYAMAAGRSPAAAFGAGGPSALVRMRRVLTPDHHSGSPVLRGLLTTGVASGAMTSLVVVCCSAPG